MSPTTQTALGLALVATGLVLALGFPDLRLLWFTGRPLGVVLAIVGAVDVAEALGRARRMPGGRP